MCIFKTSFAYLFCLANNKKANIESSVWATGTKRGMWVVVGIRITRVCLSSANEHTYYHIKGKSPEHFLTFPKGGSRYIFCEYSERVSREPRNSSCYFCFRSCAIVKLDKWPLELEKWPLKKKRKEKRKQKKERKKNRHFLIPKCDSRESRSVS